MRKRRAWIFCSRGLNYTYILKVTFILSAFANQCFSNTPSEEQDHSDESAQLWSKSRVFRLYVSSNTTDAKSKYETGSETLEPNLKKLEPKKRFEPNLEKYEPKVAEPDPSLEKSLSTFEEDDEQESFENISTERQFPLKRSWVSGRLTAKSSPAGSESNVKLGVLKTPAPFILPAAYLHNDALYGQVQPKVKGHKTKQKISKRRKQTTPQPIQQHFQAVSSIKERIPNTSEQNSNVSLKATFHPADTEELSSIELELSINGKGASENPKTQIQLANPQSQCLQISESKRKRTLLNVWSYGKGRIKLESQREVPSSILNGSAAVDGELLNRAEIPQSVANELSALLNGIGRSDNRSVFANVHLPASGESLFGGNRRPNLIMLHYILWGEQEKAWRRMLDTTVENYLRNYFVTTFGRRKSRNFPPKKINWRKMRNVLLSFMASPEVNCSRGQELALSDYPKEEFILPHRFQQITTAQPLSDFHPLRSKPNLPVSDGSPITRHDGIGYGWQQNGWGAPQQQQGWGVPYQQHGWGVQQINSGWGWGGDQGGKKKKKKKKSKKKGKKKKGKKKKGKKKKKKKGGYGWGDPPGWGWGHPPQPLLHQISSGWDQVQWNSFEFDPAEIAHKGLAVIGLFAIPIAVFVGACVVVYLITTKHKSSAPQYIHSTVHRPAHISTPLIFRDFPSFGWRRRTERPMLPTDKWKSPDAANPLPTEDPDDHRDYPNSGYGPRKKSAFRAKFNSGTSSIKTPPKTFSEIKDSSTARRNKLSDYDSYARHMRKRGHRMRGHDKRDSGHGPYYNDEEYEANKIHEVYTLGYIPTRTKQEEELIKILSKHKKARLDELLQKWKLDKTNKSWM